MEDVSEHRELEMLNAPCEIMENMNTATFAEENSTEN